MACALLIALTSENVTKKSLQKHTLALAVGITTGIRNRHMGLYGTNGILWSHTGIT